MSEQANLRWDIYGSFLSDDVEFAINAHELQEVVRYDKYMASVPLSPAYFLGIFSLRKAIIPVINMRALFEQNAVEYHKDNCIAIVFVDGVRLGLLFDTTSEVLRVKPDQLDVFDYSGETPSTPVSGTITLGGEDRLIQVLSARFMTKLDNIPHHRDKSASIDISRKQMAKTKCITFYSREIRYGFRIDAISEIISVPEIEVTGVNSRTCLGEMVLRGTTLPVVDFSMLSSGKRSAISEVSGKRIIIARIDKQPVGFMVDSVDSIIEYYVDSLQPLPDFGPDSVHVCQGCVSMEGQDDISMINHQKLFAMPEVTAPASVIAQGNDFDRKQKEDYGKGHVPQTLLVVSVDFRFALPVESISEIIEFPTEIIPISGGPSHVVGMFNLRRILVTIIDLRSLYGLSKPEEEPQSKLLIVKYKDSHLALLVDTVEDIFSTKPGSVHDTPGGIMKGASEAFQEDATSAVLHEGKVVLVFDIDSMLHRILPDFELIKAAA